MKQLHITFLLTMLMSMVGEKILAHDIAVENEDGVTIYYNYINDGKELEVTYNSSYNVSGCGYEGVRTLIIPEIVTFMSRTRKVTSIGNYAFYNVDKLEELVIGDNVEKVGSSIIRQDHLQYRSGSDEDKLKKIVIGKNVSIWKTSFAVYDNSYKSSLKKIVVKDIAKFCSIDFELSSHNPLTTTHHLFIDDNTEITNLEIPEGVVKIGSNAFCGLTNIVAASIPNSVVSIGEYAFYENSLKSVIVGSGVSSIGGYAFQSCHNLQKVIVKDIAAWCNIDFDDEQYGTPFVNSSHHNILRLYSDENTEITNLVIPEGVLKIKPYAFLGCADLRSVIIPNSTTMIERSSFKGCSNLESLSIGNSVEKIGYEAFRGCSNLININWGKSIASIDDYAFYNCGFETLTLPYGLTTIGWYSFHSCSNLVSITIPNSVTEIHSHAFYCVNLAEVISLIQEPYAVADDVFHQNTIMNGTLYVPKGTINKYKNLGGWKKFKYIEEYDGTIPDTQDNPQTQKCATPTISYRNGRLMFECATKEAMFSSSITDADMGNYSTQEITLVATYNISVYAAKSGYENSDVVTATLCWIDQEPVINTDISESIEFAVTPVLIQNNSGTLTIQGAQDGTPISVYTIAGTQAGTAVSQNSRATISTSMQQGDIAIIKIGEKSIKLVIK